MTDSDNQPYFMDNNKQNCSIYIFAVLEVLLPTDLQQTLLLNVIGQRFKAELGASGGQRLNDPEETSMS